MTTAINAPALANSSLTLPELSPRQIAQDVRIITHPQTGQLDYILPSFDPFENDPTLAGTAQLRSANNTVTIDGHSVRGGAILDLTFYYNTNTSDPYDTRGYGDAAFLSGDYADVTLQDSRILECSQDIQDVVYYHEDYYAPSFHSNLYRPYRHYSGFNGFGSRAFGGFNSFGIIGGSLLGRSFIGNRGFNARANTIRRDIIRNRRINERRSDLEDRLRDGNERRNRRDAGDRVRDNNRPDGRRTDNRNRDNRDDARPRRRNNDRIRNNERREERRRRLTDEQRRAFTSRNADSTVANNNITSSRRRIVRPNRGSQGVVSARNSLRSNRRADREVRLTNAATARTSPKQSTNKQVSQRKSSPKTTQNRSQSRQQNNSGKQSRTTRNSQSRSKSQSRNKSKNFQSRSNLRGARIIALGPMASLFGRSNVRQVSTQCAREEILSLHFISRQIILKVSDRSPHR